MTTKPDRNGVHPDDQTDAGVACALAWIVAAIALGMIAGALL